MKNTSIDGIAVMAVVVAMLATTDGASAEKRYGPGISDTEIKVGNLMPYSGPASAYSVIGKAEEAYFRKINDDGGVNGRKITFISYDDAYSPPKTVEQARKLVESDEVALIFSPLGTAANTAILKYLNGKKVPHLFVATGGTGFGQPEKNPWTMGLQPNFRIEGEVYGRFVAAKYPKAKIGILFQNDDFGKDAISGFKSGLGDKAASMVVAETSYQTSDPTIDSQILVLKDSGSDLFFDVSTPRFAAQAIKKLAEIGWKPIHVLTSTSASIGSVIKPAGYANSQGIISTAFWMDPNDPQWKATSGVRNWTAFLEKYYPDANREDGNIVYGYTAAQILVQVLKQCGDDLSRDNIMKQAASLNNLSFEMLLPDVLVHTSPTDYSPIEQLRMVRFEGERWTLIPNE